MGLFKERRERREAEQAAAATTRAAADYDQRLQAWEWWRSKYADSLEIAQEFEGLDPWHIDDLSLRPAKGEKVFMVVVNCALVEPRKPPAQWSGGSRGVSIRVMKGVSYRVGASSGRMVPQEERPTAIDEGTVTITNQRVVFQGPKQAREWAFAKTLGHTHLDDPWWTAIQVSNRQKVSGFAYGYEASPDVRFRLELALARHGGPEAFADFISDLKEALVEHEQDRPTPPPAIET